MIGWFQWITVLLYVPFFIPSTYYPYFIIVPTILTQLSLSPHFSINADAQNWNMK